MWAAKNASGNHGPTEVAQSRIWIALGNGTSTATAMRITIAARMAMKRRGGTVAAVAITAARSARRVLTTALTLTNTTGGVATTRPHRQCESAAPAATAVMAII